MSARTSCGGAGAPASATAPGGAFGGRSGDGRSGADGQFTIDGVAAGRYDVSGGVPVRMTGPGGGSLSTTVTTMGPGTATFTAGVSGGVVVSTTATASTTAGQPTDVVVADADVSGVRVVVRRPR